jgi:hypothetical protein
MRNGIIGVASSILLSGVVALGPAIGQSAEPATQAGQAQTTEGGGGEKPALQQPAAALSDNVDCSRFTSPQTCEGHFVIRSTEALRKQPLFLKAVLATPDGAAVPVFLEARCEGCSVDRVPLGTAPAVVVPFTLTLPRDWSNEWPPRVATGLIGFASASNLFDGTPRRLRVLASSPSNWQTVVVLLPAVLAALMTVGVAVKLAEKTVTLSHRMGAPSWKASESWSSNLTVGAGLVTGAIALVSSDLTVFMTKPSYGVVSMLFASLVLLAPIVYGLARQSANASTPEFVGPVWAFLAAGLLTVWASGGQLLTFALIIGEIWRARTISGEVASLVIALSIIVFAALFKYGYSSMVAAAALAKPATVTKAGVGKESVSAAGSPPWSLL